MSQVSKLVILAIALVGATAHADGVGVGDRVVELDVAVDRAGKPFRLAGLRGRWFLLTVGAEWCGPCKKELPIWDKLAAELRGKITFVALSVDDEIEDGKRFHTKLGLSHMLLAYLPQEKSSVAGRYGAATMPSTFIIDPKGIVRYVRAGFDRTNPDGEYKAMKATITKLVGPPPVKPDPPAAVKPAEPPPVKPDPPPEVKPDPDPPAVKPEPPLEWADPTPIMTPPDPEPAPPVPAAFSRGFALDVGVGPGVVRDGGVVLARIGVGVALSPSVVAGLRVGVGAASGEAARVSLGLVTAGVDLDIARGFAGGGAGAAVVDNHAAFALEVRAGWYVMRWNTHAVTLSLEGTTMMGNAGISMVTLVAGYRHR